MRFLRTLFFLLLAPAAYADECEPFKPMDHVRAQKSTDQRLIDITARVAREMGVPQRHLVCEWTGMWYPIPGVWHNVGSYKIGDDIDWALMWPTGTIDSYTDNGLLGILGHEVGHLLGEHEKSGIDLRGIRISKALFSLKGKIRPNL